MSEKKNILLLTTGGTIPPCPAAKGWNPGSPM